MFYSKVAFFSWLQNHLVPCPFKYFTGIDCPLCGFQRALILLIKGNFYDSFILYPPAIPLLFFFAYGAANSIWKLDNNRYLAKKTLFMITGAIVLVNYGFKIWLLCTHHNAAMAAV